MKKTTMKNERYFVGDFETTVYDKQERTDVWASAIVELYSENVKILHTIDETFEYLKSLKSNIIIYYHNLKFDGSFWIDYLMNVKHFEQAVYKTGEDYNNVEFIENYKMRSNTFKYLISEMGQWYTITIKTGRYIIEIRDSLKLLPFSVRKIGAGFFTKHKKLDMEYTGFRYPGCHISDEEKKYIANDVLVVKEALELMYSKGHNKLTIGACCLSEYKNICMQTLNNALEYDEMFPDITAIELDKELYGSDNADSYIRKSYKGGWCYLVKGKENKLYKNGVTADVNSLYPSMMSSESGNYYPVGMPHFWKGNFIPKEAQENNNYFFIRIRTRFVLKSGMLPFIQIKGNSLYKGTECLQTSDIYDEKTGKYYSKYKDINGNVHDSILTLTLTQTDYILFKEHYNLFNFEILDGCWFYTLKGIFDEYINKYKKIKLESKGAMRMLAKLFLNNLYGKMAASTDSSFKYAFVKEDTSIGFVPVNQNEKKPGYIPVGSAITSYARNFTIRAAQKNYYGIDKPGFIYADTDSIHCDLSPEQVRGITIHPKNFCCWKLETSWDYGWFVRQKTYIEHVVAEDLKPIEKSYFNIKCAGLPDKCKKLFELSMQGTADINGYIGIMGDKKEWTDEEKKFLFDADGKPIVRTIYDFKKGLTIPDKLLPKRIPGGILLVNTNYEMR